MSNDFYGCLEPAIGREKSEVVPRCENCKNMFGEE